MAGTSLKLKFMDKHEKWGMTGVAWVTWNGHDITADCAGMGELEARLKELEKDIQLIRREGHKRFAKAQGYDPTEG